MQTTLTSQSASDVQSKGDANPFPVRIILGQFLMNEQSRAASQESGRVFYTVKRKETRQRLYSIFKYHFASRQS